MRVARPAPAPPGRPFRHSAPEAHMKPLFVTLSLLCAPPIHVQHAHAQTSPPVLDRIRASGRIVLAHRESSVPFSYRDASDRPVGYALDLCHWLVGAVKHALGVPSLAVSYVPVTAENR